MSETARRIANRVPGMAVHREKVWRWENRGVVPDDAAQRALAAEFRISERLVADHPWPQWLVFACDAEPTGGVWDAGSAAEVLDRVLSSVEVDRRDFPVYDAMTIGHMAWTWSQSIITLTESRESVSRHVTDYLQTRIAQLWLLDDQIGGEPCFEAGLGELRLVTTLLRKGRHEPGVQQHLLRHLAALERFTGWAAFDAGREAAAQRLWHAGLRTSAAAGDPDQGVYILSCVALQAAYAGDGTTTLDALDAARSQADPAQDTVLAMLDCWSSRGHALLGDARRTAHALHQADAHWEARSPGDDPDWAYWMPQPSATCEAGTALLHVGELQAAEQALTAGLAALGADDARDRALYLARMAELHYAAGRRDQADALAVTVSAQLEQVHSQRVRNQIAKIA
ncbi:hypothetical protein [Catenuloplanes japonicus]|uniref:hypothetical protein n=1 Tax=Catenuloplanes japonicus TaxID=33876 RepID=UPI0012F7CCD4|nr:hypothetical protein [Catenuloplanes japonicus]